jgi:hypothetical protein
MCLDMSEQDLLTIVWIRLSMLSSIHSISLFYIMYQSIQMLPKEVPLDDYVDELLNGGKQLDFVDAPQPSMGTSNSCCFPASPMTSPAPPT